MGERQQNPPLPFSQSAGFRDAQPVYGIGKKAGGAQDGLAEGVIRRLRGKDDGGIRFANPPYVLSSRQP